MHVRTMNGTRGPQDAFVLRTEELWIAQLHCVRRPGRQGTQELAQTGYEVPGLPRVACSQGRELKKQGAELWPKGVNERTNHLTGRKACIQKHGINPASDG